MEDEEVVLSHSPLDGYLQNVSPEAAYAVYTRPCEKEEEIIQKETTAANQAVFDASTVYVLQACDILLKCDLLTEGDNNLLLECHDEVSQLLKNTSETQTTLYKWPVLAGCLALLPALYNYYVLPPVLCFCGIFAFFRHKKQLSLESLTPNVVKFTQVSGSFVQLLDKCILHIKEVGVVYRSRSVFSLPGLPTDESDIQRKASKLNKIIIEKLIETIQSARSIINLLRNRNCKWELKEEFVASYDGQMFEKLLENNDDCEITKIKQLTILFRILLSELIYTLIIDLKYYKQARHLDTIMKFADIIANSTSDVDFYLKKSISRLFKPLKEENKNNDTKKEINEETLFDKNLHSAQIQLLSAINCVEELKTSVEKDKTSAMFLQFNLALESTRSLVEDAVKFGGVVVARETDPPTHATCWLMREVENVVPYVEAPPQGDQLYEGESEIPQEDNNVLSLEEEIQNKQSSQESKRLMKELKYILAAKDNPEGLLSFPLQKPANIEDIEEVDEIPKKPSYKRPVYEYETQPEMNVVFRLPTHNRKIEEETFGSSSGEEEENEN